MTWSMFWMSLSRTCYIIHNKNAYQHYVTPEVSLTGFSHVSSAKSCEISLLMIWYFLMILTYHKHFLWSIIKPRAEPPGLTFFQKVSFRHISKAMTEPPGVIFFQKVSFRSISKAMTEPPGVIFFQKVSFRSISKAVTESPGVNFFQKVSFRSIRVESGRRGQKSRKK